MKKVKNIALVHDDLVQWGGAEKVLKGMSDLFPDAPIYTSIYDDTNLLISEAFSGKKIITSFLQKIPLKKTLYKTLLPAYPLAFESFDFSGFDLVISQTTRFAKCIITKPETKHICYCHTPPRFLWNDDLGKGGVLKHLFDYLRRVDQISASRVDEWVAGSKNAESRIKTNYHQNSKVIYPFVYLNNGIESFNGEYLLVISRLNFYKRIDLVIKAASSLGLPLKIVGVGPEGRNLRMMAGENVEFLGQVSETVLQFLLAGCKAILIAGEEDFGLTSIEGQAMGKPVIAFGKGGACETVIDGETGFLFKNQSVVDIIEALKKLEKFGYNRKRCIENANRFSWEKFKGEFQGLAT